MKRTKKPLHRLTELDTDLMMGWCAGCDTLVKIIKDKIYNGEQLYRCKNRHRETNDASKKPYKQHKKTFCEEPGCTATILYACQLTVDHIDGNRHNNELDNLMTLCHNCHALKSFRNNDYLNKYD